MQETLFPLDPIEKAKPGAQWTAGAWHCRNFNGWMQSREGGQGPWQFQIYGFSGPEDGDGTAAVYRIAADGTLKHQDVPIDRHNRILVDGRRYGRDHWDH